MHISHNQMFTSMYMDVCVCVCHWMLLLYVNKFIPESSYQCASQVAQW